MTTDMDVRLLKVDTYRGGRFGVTLTSIVRELAGTSLYVDHGRRSAIARYLHLWPDSG